MLKRVFYGFFLLTFILVFSLFMGITFSAADVISAPGGEVKNYEELITALGGSKAATIKQDCVLIVSDIKLEKPIVFVDGEFVITGAGCTITSAFNDDSFFIVGDGEKQVSVRIGSTDALTENDSVIFDGGNKTLQGSILRICQKSEVSVYVGTVFCNVVSDICGGSVYNEGTFNMYGGRMENSLCTGSGGAIFNKGNMFLSGGRIEKSASEFGGAVYNEGKLELIGTEISSCQATKGGAVFNSGTLNFRSSTASDCKATSGGAVYNSGTSDLIGGQIKNCTADKFGGAVYNSGTIKFSGTYFEKNSALSGGSIFNSSNAGVTDGQIFAGSAAECGGNFFNDKDAKLLLSGGTIASGKSKYGGGIFNIGDVEVTGGLITSNKADVGSGILNEGTLTFKENSYISDNNDVCIVVEQDGSHAVNIASELKADTVAILSPAFKDGDNYLVNYEEGITLIKGDFVSESYYRFKVASESETSWLLSSGGSIYKKVPVYYQAWFYFAILGSFILFVGFTVLVIRLYDKKIIRFSNFLKQKV